MEAGASFRAFLPRPMPPARPFMPCMFPATCLPKTRHTRRVCNGCCEINSTTDPGLYRPERFPCNHTLSRADLRTAGINSLPQADRAGPRWHCSLRCRTSLCLQHKCGRKESSAHYTCVMKGIIVTGCYLALAGVAIAYELRSGFTTRVIPNLQACCLFC